MPVFAYKAIDLDASAVGGTIIADTARQARDLLRERGLTITAVRTVAEGDRPTFAERRRGRKAQGEVVAALREMATLLATGIPLLAALDTLLKQHGGRFRAVLQQVRDQVTGGSGLADAMARHPAWFDETSVAIARVGESTGTLAESLKHLAAFKEKGQRLKGRITTALVYPAIVSVIGLAVCLFLMTYVVPTLVGALEEAGRTLPAVTRAVKAASDFLLAWWWAILAGLGGVVVALRLVWATERGRFSLDRLILAVPVIGELVRKETTSRMAVVMAALLRSGVRFGEAVRITRETLRSRVFRRALDDYEKAVTAGRNISEPLEAAGVFSPLVVQVLAVGQESGRLEEMLEGLAEGYDHQVATATERLTAAVEPLLIVLLAVLVGTVAFATILPILEASHVM